ncbi:MAG: phosphate ABC transporter permease PstA [Azospirillum sp.]|nr:phosphate ABC transporter permease PstA [Azospirillum sp.]
MTDIVAHSETIEQAVPQALSPSSRYKTEEFAARVRRRHKSESRFRWLGIGAISIAAVVLVTLISTVVLNGYTGFFQTRIELAITFDPEVIDPSGTRSADDISGADYLKLIRDALAAAFPEITSREDRRAVVDLVSSGAPFQLRQMVMADPNLIGTTKTITLLASDNVDQLMKGHIARSLPEIQRNVSDRQIGWVDALAGRGQLGTFFSLDVVTQNNSRQPELAGMRGAIIGSFLTLLITMVLAVPVGVAAAVYLEEFAPKNRWTDLIEVNINNLAAVPSIVFGLLGLAMFLNFFGLPRSAPLVGGMVLALMTLPIVIIASRAALKAVPPSIREAALGIGASPLQVVTHHVLPLAMPGILTGTIIGMGHALGETAPLLMIGMVAFVADTPTSVSDPASVLPVQIYMWAESAERGWVERTAAAIMILLTFLILMNGLAVYLRRKFERRW